MKNMKYLILSATALLALVSCRREEMYTPAEKEEGSHFYFSAAEMTVKVDDSHQEPFIELYRTDAAEVSKVIAVNDTSGIFFSSNSAKLDFPAKNHKSKLTFSVIRDQLVIGRKYAIGFKIPSETTAYGLDSLTVIIDYPEPWTAFDKPGYFQDNYYFAFPEPVEVTVERNELYPNRYRVVNPYKVALGSAQGATADDYLNFEIFKKGDVLNGVTLTENGIVVFEEYNTGYHHSTYDDDLVWIHVSDPFLNKKSWYAECQSMDEYLYTSVIKWIDEDNLVPGIIQFDPFYMLKNLYGGWWAEGNETVTLIMPDYEILDTSVEVAFNSFRYDAKYNPSIAVDVVLGEDVESAKAVLVAGNDLEAAVAAIIAGGDDVIEVEKTGEVVIPIPADAPTGKYSVVVASFTEDGEYAEASYVSVNYVKAGEVPDPISWEYGASDVIEAISKDDLIATNWSLYASPYDDTAEDYAPIQKLGAVSITDFAEIDAEPEIDTVLVKGLSAGFAESVGFDDTMAFEYYEGVIYNLGSEFSSFNYNGNTFYIEPEWGILYNGKHSSDVEAYLVLGGLVSDSILAFVETEEVEDEQFDGALYWSIYTDPEDSDTWTGDPVDMINPRLVADDAAPVAPAPAARLKAISKAYAHRSNLVETNRGYLKRCIDEHILPKNIGLGTKQVTESGKVQFRKAVDLKPINR